MKGTVHTSQHVDCRSSQDETEFGRYAWRRLQVIKRRDERRQLRRGELNQCDLACGWAGDGGPTAFAVEFLLLAKLSSGGIRHQSVRQFKADRAKRVDREDFPKASGTFGHPVDVEMGPV